MKYQNIVEKFYSLLKDYPSANLFAYIDDDGKEVESLTISRFSAQVETIASKLVLDHNISIGDHVALVYPPGLDFVKAFWACVIIGAVPVPLAPNIVQDITLMRRMISTSDSKLVLMNQTMYTAVFVQAMKKIQFGINTSEKPPPYVLTDNLRDDGASKIIPHTKASPDDVCFLQYTSGSTSEPKGVMITYGNLSHQLQNQITLLDHVELYKDPSMASKHTLLRNKALIWLPHNHDFSLISFICSSLFGNASLHMFSPIAFVKKPAMWFELMSKHLITHSAAPNFAYDLAVRKTTPQDRAKYDLSRLRILMCAAEPISTVVIEKFLKEFSVSKLNPKCFCSAYGMAENSVAISVQGNLNLCVDRLALEKENKIVVVEQEETQNDSARVLVGCGLPVLETAVRIVNYETFKAVPDGEIGEIWVFSPSKAKGYYKKDELTNETFHAQIVDRSEDFIEPNDYLRTGDLGCIYKKEVFVTGRLKDMIIFAGRKVYPQDIEESIRQADELIRKGGVAVVNLTSDEYFEHVEERSANTFEEDHIVAVVETVRDVCEEENATIVSNVRKIIQKNHQINGCMVVLCKAGSVAKTTSGKVQRSKTKTKLLDQQIQSSVKDAHQSSGSLLQSLASITSLALSYFAPSLTAHSSNSSVWKHAKAKSYTRFSSFQLPSPEDKKSRVKHVFETDNMRSSFRDIISRNCSFFINFTKFKKHRVFHNKSTVLTGAVHFSEPEMPFSLRNDFFRSNSNLKCLIRFSNGVQDDDRVPDVRGASIRIYKDDDMENSVWDLLLTTGDSFPSSTAAEFEEWRKMSYSQREEIASKRQSISDAVWNQQRLVNSYSEPHYYAVSTYEMVTIDNSGRQVSVYARFRIVPSNKQKDTGFLNRNQKPLPAENFEVDPTDTRTSDFLHDEIKKRCEQERINFVLQAQIQKKQQDEGSNDHLLDCLIPWNDEKVTWMDVGSFKFDQVFNNCSKIEEFDFNPMYSPSSIQIPLAESDTTCASLSHLRMIVYYVASFTRHGIDESQFPVIVKNVVTPNDQNKEKILKVAILGAGVTGLTAAYELKKLGHIPTVFEKDKEVGGKCASIDIEGKPYDVGGHVCTDMYKTLIKVMEEIGVSETEPATGTKVYDLERNEVQPQKKTEELKNEFFKYTKLRETNFPKINSSNLIDVVKYSPVVLPVPQAVKELGLEQLVYEVGLRFTSCGYGFATDKQLPLMYVLKAAETASILSTGNSEDAWTMKGGFGSFWKKVADKIGDVRLETYPTKIARTNDGIKLLFNDDHEELYDKVVISSNKKPEILGKIMELTDQEKHVFSQIRSFEYYTTAVKIEGTVPELGFHLFKQYCEDEGFVGYPVCYHHRYAGINNLLVYSYGDEKNGIDGNNVVTKLKETFENMGCKVAQVYWQKKWDYFPHFSSDSILEGNVQKKLEDLQGMNNTFYTGSIFNFELIECNMSHVTAMVDKFFSKNHFFERKIVKAVFFEEFKKCSEEQRSQLVMDYVVKVLKNHLRTTTGHDQDIDLNCSFQDYGLDSITSIRLSGTISQDCGFVLQPVTFFDYSTPSLLGNFLENSLNDKLSKAGSFDYLESYEQDEPVEVGKSGNVSVNVHVFRPKRTFNGFGIIEILSGGYRSGNETIELSKIHGFYNGMCNQGFHVFSAEIGSIGSETLFDMMDNISYVVDWVKTKAADYCVDPRKLVMVAGSSGGHLASLYLLGVRPPNPNSKNFQSNFRSSAKGSVIGGILYAPVTDSISSAGIGSNDLDLSFKLFAQDNPETSELVRRRRLFSPLHNVPDMKHSEVRFIRLYHSKNDPVIPCVFSKEFINELRDKGLKNADYIEVEAEGHPWNSIHEDYEDAAIWTKDQLVCFDITKSIPILPQIEIKDEENVQSDPKINLIHKFAQKWSSKPSFLLGSASIYYLSFALRISKNNNLNEPLFSSVIDQTLKTFEQQGNLGIKYVHPYTEWISTFAFISTLVKWDDLKFKDYSKEIHKLVNYAMNGPFKRLLGLKETFKSFSPYGSFGGFPGEWLLPVYEVKPLLESKWLNDDQKEQLDDYLSRAPITRTDKLQSDEYREIFDTDSLVLVFGEFFPENILKSDFAQKQIRKNPYYSPAMLFKYYELTKDAGAEDVIKTLNVDSPFDNFVPRASRLNETLFALHYLVKGGIDVKKHFSKELKYFETNIAETGVPIEEGSSNPDSDCTAVAMFISNSLKLAVPFKTDSIEKWWIEANRNYQNTDEGNRLVLSVLLHVLEAYLADEKIDHGKKLSIWSRVVSILEENEWTELYHISPIYIWEKIIYSCFTYQHLFPERKTDIHYKALNALLALYDPSTGGFTSGVLRQPANLEESSLALLSIKHILKSEHPGIEKGVVELLKNIVLQSEKYVTKKLQQLLSGSEENYISELPEFWPTKVGAALPNVVFAEALASLQ